MTRSAFVAALFVACVATSAYAAPETEEEPEHRTVPTVAFELGVSAPTTPGGSVVVLVPRLAGRTPLAGRVELSLDVGLGIVRVGVDGQSASAVRLGNAAVGFHYHVSSELRLGLGATLPLARLGDNRSEGLAALLTAAAIDGNRDLWMWLPEVFSLYLPLRWETMVGSALRFTFEGAGALYVPSSSNAEVTGGLQGEGRLAYIVDRSWFGLGLQSTVLFIPDDSPLAQLALVPRVHWSLGTAFVDARFVLNLDEPLGFAFDAGRIWGLFVGLGTEL